MLPYVERAIKEGYAVLIANPNHNTGAISSVHTTPIPHSVLHVVTKGSEKVRVEGM